METPMHTHIPPTQTHTHTHMIKTNTHTQTHTRTHTHTHATLTAMHILLLIWSSNTILIHFTERRFWFIVIINDQWQIKNHRHTFVGLALVWHGRKTFSQHHLLHPSQGNMLVFQDSHFGDVCMSELQSYNSPFFWVRLRFDCWYGAVLLSSRLIALACESTWVTSFTLVMTALISHWD